MHEDQYINDKYDEQTSTEEEEIQDKVDQLNVGELKEGQEEPASPDLSPEKSPDKMTDTNILADETSEVSPSPKKAEIEKPIEK